MRKNQKHTQINETLVYPSGTHWQVRALRYHYRYVSEHPDLRKGRYRLFIPVKENCAGKELSAAAISRWICATIVDSHASLQKSKNSPRKSKYRSGYLVTAS